MDAQVLLQVMLVFERLAAFSAFELTVAGRLRDVPLSDEERGGSVRCGTQNKQKKPQTKKPHSSDRLRLHFT